MATVARDLPTLRSFTVGLRRDIQAVTAGLIQPYNSGAVEARPAHETHPADRNTEHQHLPTPGGHHGTEPELKSPLRSDDDGHRNSTPHTPGLDASRRKCSHRCRTTTTSQDHET